MASCGTLSHPPKPDASAARACDPRLTVPLPAAPAWPQTATVVRPSGGQEAQGYTDLLTWTGDLGDWARDLAKRAELARADCAKR